MKCLCLSCKWILCKYKIDIPRDINNTCRLQIYVSIFCILLIINYIRIFAIENVATN